MDLVFLGHRNATITIALLAAFFSVTKSTARLKPGGTERRATRTKPETFRNLSPARMKDKALVQCVLAYLSSSLSLFLVARNPCVCNTPETSLDT